MRYTKLVKKILKEMSAPWPDFSENDSYLNAAKVPENSNLIQTISLSGEKFQVFEYRYKNNTASIYVVDGNKKMRLTIRFGINSQDNSIRTTTVQKHSDSKFYYSDFIKKVLLTRYSYMLSDDSHTKASFGLYKRLASDPEVDLSVVDINTGKTIPVDNGEELEQYYGEGLEHFIYKVSLR